MFCKKSISTILIVAVVFSLLLLTACGENDNEKGEENYSNNNSTEITYEPYTGPADERGNTNANIVNGGTATIKDDWIYFVKQYGEKTGKIFAMKMDGSDCHEIIDDKSNAYLASDLNVVGDRIFYNSIGLHTMKIDGSDHRKIHYEGDRNSSGNSIGVKDLIVVGGQMYFISNGIHAMETNGSNERMLSDYRDHNPHDLNVDGDRIYYINAGEDYSYNIYTRKTDGSDWRKLCDDHATDLNVVGDRIYYTIVNDHYSLYSIKTDGSDRRKICDDHIVDFNATENWIYYEIGAYSGNRLCRIKPDGSDKQELDSNIYTSDYGINIAGDWIFVYEYRMRTDGSNKVFYDGRSSNGNPVTSEQQNPSVNMTSFYYNYLISTQKIETKASETVGGDAGRTVSWDVNELKYYIGDFNYDGISDLAISAGDGNGVVIYTYQNEKVVPLFSFGMPYSAGSETCTLAVHNNGEYGILTYRHNSTQPFSFLKIDKNGGTQPNFVGACFDENGNPTDAMIDFNNIGEVLFYGLEELKIKTS